MNEETLFALALEKKATERAAFLEEACSQDPALRQRIEALLESHQHSQFLETPAVQLAAEVLGGGETTGPRPLDPVDDEITDSCFDFLAPSDKPGSLGRLGHYDIQEVIGRGGMGIVLRAFDERLHRVVAIKFMAAQLATSATARKRFTREAQAVAAVSHEHVVTIHAVEEGNGRPYIVMHYVAGSSLEQRLQHNGPLELQEILRIGMQTALGLVAAHAQGLIHRDIKPANILLENCVDRVKLTDFGLARAAADASLTQSGAVAGTPQYMAPEQAHGGLLDARTDLFSLGSVLYAMCTGHSPFRASSTMAVLKRVCEETPTPIRGTNPEIPEWLVAIIDKLHAKDPAERFQSAAEVADLLSRHLAHAQHPSVAPLPAHIGATNRGASGPARPASPTIFQRRWAVAAAVLLCCLLGGFSLTEATGVTQLASTVIRILTPEGTLLVEVDDPEVKVTIEGDGGLVITGAGPQEVRVRPGSYQVRATKDGQPVRLDRDLVMITRGQRKVMKVSLVPQPAGLSATAKQRLMPVATPVRRFEGHTGEIRSMALSPDGRRILSGGDDGTVRYWDVESGREIRQFTAGHPIASVAFSADGHRVLTSGWGSDGIALLWDVESGKELQRFSHGELGMLGAALSPDSRHALTSGHDNTLRLWDVESGGEVRRFEYDEPVAVRTIASSPDGKYAVTGALDATPSSAVRLWDVDTGKEVRQFRGHSGWIASVVFSTDGQRVVSASWDQTLRLWDVASGRELLRMDHADRVDAVAASLDGHRALSGCFDGSIHLWNLETGKLLLQFQAHEGAVKAVALHPNGRNFVSAGADAAIRLWTLPDNAIQKASTSIPGTFVLLGGEVVAEQTFDTLEDAVLHASDGDTIEIQGNGPFVMEPVAVREHGLTLRAARGSCPVLVLSARGAGTYEPMIRSAGSLVIEGIEFRRFGQKAWTEGKAVPTIVSCSGHSLFLANCCFRGDLQDQELVHAESEVFVARNCAFVGPTAAILCMLPRCREVSVENCVHLGRIGLCIYYLEPARESVEIRLKRNTFLAVDYQAVHFAVYPSPARLGEATDITTVRVESTSNVIDARCALYYGAHPFTLETQEEDPLRRRVLSWGDRDDLFFLRGPALDANSSHVLERLGEWNRYWNQADSAVIHGRCRYEGGDLGSRLTSFGQAITPGDFRLRPDSAGYRAGADGKDLGADVDLVGSGPAYERWKKTPEYETWLQETGHGSDLRSPI